MTKAKSATRTFNAHASHYEQDKSHYSSVLTILACRGLVKGSISSLI